MKNFILITIFRILYCTLFIMLGFSLALNHLDYETRKSAEHKLVSDIWELNYIDGETPMLAIRISRYDIGNERYFVVYRIEKETYDLFEKEPQRLKITLEKK